MFEPYELGPIDCGYCGNKTQFTVVAQDTSQLKTHEWEDKTPWGRIDNSVQRGWIHRMLICSACGRASFDRLFTHDGEPEAVEMLYPQPVVLPDGLPANVAKEYGEAIRERRRNPNGYAALLGRVLDAVCNDRGIPNKKADGYPIYLGKRLSELTKKENLRPIEGAVGLRNIAAHSDLGGLLPQDIPYLEALIKYLLDHLYVISAVNQRALASGRGATAPSPP